MYQIYCLTIPTSYKIQINYIYIDANILSKYRNILSKIIVNFNNYAQITQKKILDATSYFNVYHYFTIKKLNNFFEYVIPKMGDKIMSLAEILIEEGIENNKLETARDMLIEGCDPVFVAKITKLPLDKIKALQKSLS